MKIPVLITQLIVGILFIISGLVKANDPLGLSYKMEEFFELWNAGLQAGSFFAKSPLIAFFNFLHKYSLALSVFMITLEIVTGVALLVGWKKKFILNLLLVLILFFTFLTGYAYLSGKFTNCGCFGDCLPIAPQTSFLKDIALLILIIFLMIGQKFIQPAGTNRFRNSLLVGSLFLSLLLQWYVLNYLPMADCLPFKKGNNITEKMKAPAGSVPDSVAIRYVYEKDGKRFEWAPEELPADFESYTYIDRVDKVIRKGNADPPIKGFSLIDTAGTDLTSSVLSQPIVFIAFAIDTRNAPDWISDFKRLNEFAGSKNIPVYLASSSRDEFIRLFAQHKLNVPVLACDFTVIRTAARTNPTLYYLKNGTIENKYSENGLLKAMEQIKKL